LVLEEAEERWEAQLVVVSCWMHIKVEWGPLTPAFYTRSLPAWHYPCATFANEAKT